MSLAAYRPNVGVVLINPAGLVWLGRRANTTGPLNWQFPQGGVDDGEDHQAAAVRELHEETGVHSVSFLGRTDGWICYDFPDDHGGSKQAKGWRGQKQVWFALRFDGQDDEVNLLAHPPIEFDDWRWAQIDEAVDLVVPFKRDAYRQVIDAFRDLAL